MNFILKYQVPVRETDSVLSESEYAQLVDASNVGLLAEIKRYRNLLLQESDWTMAADAPFTAEQKAAWVFYRQALRDFPSTISFAEDFSLTDGDFPQKPEIA